MHFRRSEGVTDDVGTHLNSIGFTRLAPAGGAGDRPDVAFTCGGSTAGTVARVRGGVEDALAGDRTGARGRPAGFAVVPGCGRPIRSTARVLADLRAFPPCGLLGCPGDLWGVRPGRRRERDRGRSLLRLLRAGFGEPLVDVGDRRFSNSRIMWVRPSVGETWFGVIHECYPGDRRAMACRAPACRAFGRVRLVRRRVAGSGN